MRLVRPKAELLAIYGIEEGLHYTYHDPKLLIEVAGRTCYKSEDKITHDSAKKFVKMLCERGHHAMIEHSWRVYYTRYMKEVKTITPYPTPFLYVDTFKAWVAGNIRAHAEAGVLDPDVFRTTQIPKDVLQHAIETNQPALIGMTARFVCDRGVTHELVRHRPPSYAQESTRFCDYSTDRFGRHVTFVIPPDMPDILSGVYNNATWDEAKEWGLSPVEERWIMNRRGDELDYFRMLEYGRPAQMARGELPNCLKTEIVVTASLAEWQHICALRELGVAGKPHPQMLEITEPFFAEARKHVPFFDGEHMAPVIDKIKKAGETLTAWFEVK